MKITDRWLGESALFVKEHCSNKHFWISVGILAWITLILSLICTLFMYQSYVPKHLRPWRMFPVMIWNGFLELIHSVSFCAGAVYRGTLHALPGILMFAGKGLAWIAVAVVIIFVVIWVHGQLWLPLAKRTKHDMAIVKLAKEAKQK